MKFKQTTYICISLRFSGIYACVGHMWCALSNLRISLLKPRLLLHSNSSNCSEKTKCDRFRYLEKASKKSHHFGRIQMHKWPALAQFQNRVKRGIIEYGLYSPLIWIECWNSVTGCRVNGFFTNLLRACAGMNPSAYRYGTVPLCIRSGAIFRTYSRPGNSVYNRYYWFPLKMRREKCGTANNADIFLIAMLLFPGYSGRTHLHRPMVTVTRRQSIPFTKNAAP